MNNTAISIFTFQNQPVRIVMINDNPWWVVSDVCKILDLDQVSRAVSRLNQDGVTTSKVIDSLGREQNVNIANEPNLYRLIFQSRKPNAEAFQNWVYEEVLPSIRKTGSYAIQSSQLDTAQLKTLEQTINDLRNEVHDIKQLLIGQKQVSRKCIRIVATDEKQAKILSKMHYLRAKGIKRVSPALMRAYLKSIDKYEIATIMDDLVEQKQLKKTFTIHAVNGLYELV